MFVQFTRLPIVNNGHIKHRRLLSTVWAHSKISKACHSHDTLLTQ